MTKLEQLPLTPNKMEKELAERIFEVVFPKAREADTWVYKAIKQVFCENLIKNLVIE